MIRLIEIILFCGCVFSCHFSNGISIHTSEITSSLIDHTIKLIYNGFANNSNPLIISSDLVDDQVASGSIDNGSPLIVINGDQRRKLIEGYLPSYPTFILRFESLKKLSAFIIKNMNSPTWNIKSPIFVLDISEGPHDTNAFRVLSFLGYFDILKSYYVGYDGKKDSTVVHTLNPYTQYAPSPWSQVILTNTDINNKTKQTLYSLQYPKDLKNNYKSIFFDKTQHLDGHEIKLLARTIPPKEINQNKQENINKMITFFEKFKDIGLSSLPDYIKVKASIHVHENFFSYDTKYGFDRDLVRRQYDASNLRTQLADTNPELTDILTEYHEVHYSILTKKTDYLTVLTEIPINLQFIFITIFVLMLIAVIIIMNNQCRVSEGIIDIVSMSLSMGIISPMGRLSMKIIYFFGFLFIFVVMPEFQGQISAILSQPATRNVETLKDIFDNKYHVFYEGLLKKDMIHEKLWVTEEDQKYLHPSTKAELEKCVIEAQQNSTIACIDFTRLIFFRALELKNLHVSKEIVFKKYYVHWTKKNWALKEKIDKVRSIPVETGLIYHYSDELEFKSKKIKKLQKIKEVENYERVDFENFIFYFVVFAATLLWSLVIFGIELIVYYSYTQYIRQEKKRRQFIERLRIQPRIISCPSQIVPSTSCE